MAVEIAAAYISLVPSARGLLGNLRRDFSQPLEQEASRTGDSMVTAIGSRMTRGLSIAATAAGAAIAGALATSIGLGLQRLSGIEQAQAQLRGLGHDAATIGQIMGDALSSVQGTAFGLADAVTAAAGAVAAGVQPGDDLARTLGLVGDTATIAGAGFNEMGAIFNKVAAANRLSMQEVNQLADRGIPIMQWLADEYGVTAEAARDMVSRGEVDFETFRRVIEDNIAGAALASGETTRGALANLGAAAGRLGAVLAGPVFTQARGFFVGVTGWIDGLTAAAEPFADRFGVWLADAFTRAHEAAVTAGQAIQAAVGGLVDGFQTGQVTTDGFVGAMQQIGVTAAEVSAWLSENRDTIRDVASAAATAAGAIVAFSTGAHLLSTALRAVAMATPIGVILAIGTGLVYAYQHSERFRDVVRDAFDTVSRFARDQLVPAFDRVRAWWDTNGQVVIDRVVGVFTSVRDTIGGVIDWVTGVFSSDGPASAELSGFASRLVEWGGQLVDIFRSAWDTISAVVSIALDFIRGLWDLFGDDLLVVVSAVWETIQGLIGAALDIIQGLFDVFAGIFTGDWGRVWDGIKSIFDGVWNTITSILNTALGVIQGAIGVAVQLIQTAWTNFTNKIKDLWDTIWTAIRNGFNALWQPIANAVTNAIGSEESGTGLLGLWGRFKSTVTSVWDSIWTGIKNGFNALWQPIANAVDNVIGNRDAGTGLLGAWGTFADAITDVWDTMWGGITAAVEVGGRIYAAFTGALGGLVNAVGQIWDGVRNTLAAPINWVAEHVINGLIGAVNRVSNALGAGDILSPLQVPLIPTFHEGGIVGAGGRMTPLSQLTPDELLIKVRKGEEVVTTDDPRHMANLKPWVPPTGGDPVSPSTQIGGGGGAPAFRSIGSLVSNIGGFIKDAAYSVLDAARKLIANTIRPLIEGIANIAASAVEQFGPPGRIVAAAGRVLVDKVLDWIAGVDDDVDKAISASGFGRGLEWARSQAGKPYIWGGVGPEGYDCSGFLSALTNVILGRGAHKRLFTSASIIDSAGGPYFRPGRDGEFVIGARKGNPGHVAGTLLGVNVESAGRVGVRVGGPVGGSYGTHGFSFAGTFDRGGVLAPGLNVVDNKTGGFEALRPVGDEPDMDYWREVGRQIARAAAAEQRMQQRKVRV